VGVFSEHSVD